MPRKIFFVLCVLLLSGCPRGESITAERALENARARYTAGASAKVLGSLDPAASRALEQIQAALEIIAGGDRIARESGPFVTVEERLRTLMGKAGYPSRPALNALADQYQSIAQNPPRLSESFERQTLVLLAARTYDILASELEGGKFSL